MKNVFAIIGIFLLLIGCTTSSQQSPSMGHLMGNGASSGTQGKTTLTPVERSTDDLPSAKSSSLLEVNDGDTIKLSAEIIKNDIDGSTIRMFGYNGEFPGPLIKVKQGSTITVDVTNNLDMETTVHWHGIRLENKNDGIPGVTQDPIQPKDKFRYTLTFPDAGMFWYHPHIREDYQQELGLYGNILVIPSNDGRSAVNREEVIILDDFNLDEVDVPTFYKEQINHVLMGRFGNIFLANGKEEYSLNAKKGEVIRFYLTNAANVRPYKISFTDAKMKLVASDLSTYEEEKFIDTLIIGPAERYTVDVLFEKEGISYLKHQTHHRTVMLAAINVSTDSPTEEFSSEFMAAKKYPSISMEMAALDSYVPKKPDVSWRLAINAKGMAPMVHADEDRLEYEDSMPMMTPLTTNRTMVWQIIDMESGKVNMENSYHWEVGDLVKIRLFNDINSMHPMPHPIHFHGQRFVVLAVDGVEVENKVWKDTTLVPVGATQDILLEVTNPGDWMAHCHIAEHLQSGMMAMFDVE